MADDYFVFIEVEGDFVYANLGKTSTMGRDVIGWPAQAPGLQTGAYRLVPVEG